MKIRFSKLIIYVLPAVFFLLLNSCAEIQLKAISSPPPTAKLRVYVQLITGPFQFRSGTWGTPHKEFVAKNISGVERFLEQTSIYEVVPARDVEKVLGGQDFTYREMERNGWILARQIGKALYTEYVIIIERSLEPDKMGRADLYFTITMINTGTGKRFETRARMDTFDTSSSERRSAIIKKLYHTVFLSAKNDMFETAIRKSENIHTPYKELAAATAPEPPAAAPPPEIKTEAPPAIPKQPVTPPPKLIAAIPKPEPAKPVDTASVKPRHEDISDMDRLVIYDLEAPEQYKTVALILTEVLREELFLLNRFILVNRENLLDVLREMALQQSGLIDEKQAIKAGKGLAANQVVTGSLGILGKTYLLNTKRIDVETFATLGIASTRFSKGEEEDALSRLPGLAKSLAGVR